MDWVGLIKEKIHALFPNQNIIFWEKNDSVKVLFSDEKIYNINLTEVERNMKHLQNANEVIDLYTRRITKCIEQKIYKKDKRNGVGKTLKNITPDQILWAYETGRSYHNAAMLLNISKTLFYFYVKRFKLTLPKVSKKNTYRTKTAIPLIDILKNKYPNLEAKYVKKRIVEECIFPEKCMRCGYQEKRSSDKTVPLKLFFINNTKDYRLENLRLLCFNCEYMVKNDIKSQNNIIDPIRNLDIKSIFGDSVKMEFEDIWNKYNTEETPNTSLNQLILNKDDIETLDTEFPQDTPKVELDDSSDIDELWKKLNG